MREKKTEILRIFRDTLRFHQAMGLQEYPDTESIQQFLDPGRKTVGGRAGDHRTGSESNIESTGIENLAEEVNACTLCQLSTATPGRVLGRGRFGCSLMIVGDWSLQPDGFAPETLFGREEDEMLWKMMAAINLQPDQVYVTNCLKCCPEEPGMIDNKCAESCFSYLAREIAAVNPQVICAMGEIPVRIIMGRKEPLARLRGRFGSYRYQSGPTVRVMPTFHPRFLLQQQEMKKATWNDLQAIRRCLDNS